MHTSILQPNATESKNDLPSPNRNGAEAILEILRTNGTDCIFASPIAVMAPLWEALAARRERREPEAPRYFQCRHEMLAVSLAAGYYKATGRAQAVFLPTGIGVLNGSMALGFIVRSARVRAICVIQPSGAEQALKVLGVPKNGGHVRPAGSTYASAMLDPANPLNVAAQFGVHNLSRDEIAASLPHFPMASR